MSKRASIFTLGCRLNHSESTMLALHLQNAGYELVRPEDPADLCIVNTCTVTAEADAKSRKTIRALIRRNPKAFVAVVGCYAQVAETALADIRGIDVIVGTKDKLRVLDYVAATKNEEPLVVCPDVEASDFRLGAPDAFVPSADHVGDLFPHRANLKIQDGCDVGCSYCIVPSARGPARSRAMDDLIEEARALVRRGVKEIVIAGVNVGAYDYEGCTVLDVVDRLNAIPGMRRIRVSSIELNSVPRGLLERMNDPRHALVPFLHIPLQSGSDAVLERMGRGYTAGEARAFIRDAVEAVPDLCIGTDLMAGMPGETDEDFEASCRFLCENPIAYAHVFKYSERKGTRAARMDGKVPAPVLNARAERLRRIAEAKRRRFHGRFLGRVFEVLFEERANGAWFGYAGNYLPVAACCEDNLENELRLVTLDADCGAYVEGHLHEDSIA